AMPPGDVLDLGAGEGRNAHWLAEQGWRVTAVDISQVALETLRQESWGEGWDITTIHADLRDWTPPERQFDLVLLSFVQLEQPHRGRLHREAAAAVRPGGSLVLVAHARRNLEEGTGGPQDPNLLPSRTEVEEELSDLVIDRCEVIERPVDGAERPALDLVAVAHRPEDDRTDT
ncbi:MAG: class I SAM-dependent methyltransferase, partial [Nitriliruptorales bacterium]|nr:class I SAM-dependent methyltransferase [Nitriliruptorales bacterium]